MPSRTSPAIRLAELLATVLCACAAPETPRSPEPPREAFRLDCQPIDAALAPELEELLGHAAGTVEAFFGAPFPRPFTVVVHPDRDSFDASFPPEWGLGRTECWMVASGVADGVQLLSPRAWKAEACEHDAEDRAHVERLLAHELVHVYHGQHNPSPDFVDVTGLDWFVEGLATLASGQLEDPSLLSARAALERGQGPASLARAWTGPARYGVSGSLVAFVEHELGRARLTGLLGATSEDELFDALGLGEEELLARWSVWVLAR